MAFVLQPFPGDPGRDQGSRRQVGADEPDEQGDLERGPGHGFSGGVRAGPSGEEVGVRGAGIRAQADEGEAFRRGGEPGADERMRGHGAFAPGVHGHFAGGDEGDCLGDRAVKIMNYEC